MRCFVPFAALACSPSPLCDSGAARKLGLVLVLKAHRVRVEAHGEAARAAAALCSAG